MTEWLTEQSHVKCPRSQELMQWLGYENRDAELVIFFRCPGEDHEDETPHDTELVFIVEAASVRAGVRERAGTQVEVLTDEQLQSMDGDPAAVDGGSPPSEEFEDALTDEVAGLAQPGGEAPASEWPSTPDPTQQGDA